MFVTSPAPRDAWTAVLKASPEALAYQTPAWLDCICALSGKYQDVSRLYLTTDGRRLVLPMVRRAQPAVPKALVPEASLPYFWGTGGLLAEGIVGAADVAAVLADLAGRRVVRTVVRSIARWSQQGRWRQPPELLRKYQLVAAFLGEACRIWVAWFRGEPAAATIVLVQGTNATAWRGAMDHDLAGATGAGYLAERHAIEDACLHGCRYYHFGESPSASIAFYKSRFGAKPHRYAEYRLESIPLTQAHHLLGRLTRRSPYHTRLLTTLGRVLR